MNTLYPNNAQHLVSTAFGISRKTTEQQNVCNLIVIRFLMHSLAACYDLVCVFVLVLARTCVFVCVCVCVCMHVSNAVVFGHLITHLNNKATFSQNTLSFIPSDLIPLAGRCLKPRHKGYRKSGR